MPVIPITDRFRVCLVTLPTRRYTLFTSLSFGSLWMSRIGPIIALFLALALFVFSAWIYSRTGDWVAMVFALGSVAYAFYFFTRLRGGDS